MFLVFPAMLTAHPEGVCVRVHAGSRTAIHLQAGRQPDQVQWRSFGITPEYRLQHHYLPAVWPWAPVVTPILIVLKVRHILKRTHASLGMVAGIVLR